MPRSKRILVHNSQKPIQHGPHHKFFGHLLAEYSLTNMLILTISSPSWFSSSDCNFRPGRKKILATPLPEEVTGRLDLFFADAPFAAEGKSEVDGIFDPPYYEWFQFDKDFMEYRNFDECLKYIEDLMIKEGPFDGLMGFSQGAILSAALPGLQEKGVALTKVPKVKYVVIIGGAKFQSPAVAEKAYAEKIKCTSLHFLGETDFLRKHGEALIKEFVDPHIIRHPKGHTVPRLDDKSMEIMMEYLRKIEDDLGKDEKSAQ